jgi:hypothetical protein
MFQRTFYFGLVFLFVAGLTGNRFAGALWVAGADLVFGFGLAIDFLSAGFLISTFFVVGFGAGFAAEVFEEVDEVLDLPVFAGLASFFATGFDFESLAIGLATDLLGGTILVFFAAFSSSLSTFFVATFSAGLPPLLVGLGAALGSALAGTDGGGVLPLDLASIFGATSGLDGFGAGGGGGGAFGLLVIPISLNTATTIGCL